MSEIARKCADKVEAIWGDEIAVLDSERIQQTISAAISEACAEKEKEIAELKAALLKCLNALDGLMGDSDLDYGGYESREMQACCHGHALLMRLDGVCLDHIKDPCAEKDATIERLKRWVEVLEKDNQLLTSTLTANNALSTAPPVIVLTEGAKIDETLMQTIQRQAEQIENYKTRDAEDDPFRKWAQSYLDADRWAGHKYNDAIKQELLERDGRVEKLTGALKDAGDDLYLLLSRVNDLSNPDLKELAVGHLNKAMKFVRKRAAARLAELEFPARLDRERPE